MRPKTGGIPKWRGFITTDVWRYRTTGPHCCHSISGLTQDSVLRAALRLGRDYIPQWKGYFGESNIMEDTSVGSVGAPVKYKREYNLVNRLVASRPISDIRNTCS
uniref:Transposase n=1 Tax=Steinernema glaseri TaxID=37863 RepID=A0A1I7ZSD5_9BILA